MSTTNPVATQHVASAKFTFTIPLPSAHGSTAHSRKPQYVPASTASIKIAIVQVNGVVPSPAPSPTIANVSPTAPGCSTASGNETCVVTLGLPVGNDTLLVNAFDGAGATGNMLSQQQSTFAVVQSSANTFAMTLDAAPGQIAAATPNGTTCTGSPITNCAVAEGSCPSTFTLTVADAHGTLLPGGALPGSPVLSVASTNTAVASVTATQNPYGITVQPSGPGTATIAVTAAPTTNTSGLSASTFSFSFTVAAGRTLSKPQGVAVDASGNIYVANTSGGNDLSGSVTKYAATGGAPTLTICSGLDAPYGVALDAGGNIYVTNGSSTVTEYAPSGGLPILSITSGINSPIGIALDALGNIYVAEYGANSVTKYAPGGGILPLTITDVSTPYGVALDHNGNIYVANRGNSTVNKYAASGGAPNLSISSELSDPIGVAVDASGNIYASSFDQIGGKSAVYKFLPTGGDPILTITSGVEVPWGIAVDASGDIYVASHNAVTKYRSTGGSPILTIH